MFHDKGPIIGKPFPIFRVNPDVESKTAEPLVLHIEDDDGDAHLVVRSLCRGPIPVRIQRAIDGREAISILEDVCKGDADCPDLILLDLKLPFRSGVEVLQWARDQERFHATPIVMLTSSDLESDIEACRSAGCSEYLVKPMDYRELRSTLDQVCHRYFGREVPNGENPAVVAA